MPPKGRIKHASQHDKRHDTGLAAPGKRISKDKAHSGTNGTTNGRGAHSQSPSPHPSIAVNRAQSEFETSESDRDGSAANHLSNGGGRAQEQGQRLGNTPLPGNKDGRLVHNDQVDTFACEATCSKDNSMLKAVASHAASSLSLAATILSACPLRDAIAILILFLSLPPTLVIIIHSLFASLTFVPPAAAFSWGAGSLLPTFADWFHATPGGGPSPFTILVSDIVMTLIYLVCPLHIQNILMDLGQAVIAISLSGAAAGAGSSTRSVAVCSTIILVSHLFRYKHTSIVQQFTSALPSLSVSNTTDIKLRTQLSVAHPVTYSWPRLLLGCHLLAQGLLTLIRRWFAGAAQDRHTSKLEAEQAALADSGKLAALHFDSNEAGPGGSAEGRPPGPNASAREQKEKVSNSKKKRRQANQARSQQPLWAAIASTKVSFMKELENKQISHDAAEVNSDGIRDDSMVSVVALKDRLWIQDISPTQIRFQADLALTQHEITDVRQPEVISGAGIDTSKPFFVRLNGADWASAQILAANDDQRTVLGHETKLWIGEINGLSPLTRYRCELVRLHDRKVICETTLVTSSAPNMEQTATVPMPPPAPPLRPLSPTSTLKQSLAAAEAKLEEVRNRLKRSRKDNKTAANAIRREVEQLQSRIASSGGQDERARQRILQLRQHIKQAEDMAQQLRQESAELGDIPQEDHDEAADRRKRLDEAQEANTESKANFEEARANANKEIALLKDQIASARQKRDRLNAKKTKMTESIQQRVQEQAVSAAAKQQRGEALQFKQQELKQELDKYLYWINITRAQVEEYNAKSHEMAQSNQILEEEWQMSLAQQQQFAPPTPEGNLPGTNGPLGPLAKPFEFPPFGGPLSMPQHGQMQQPWNLPAPRQRSSSMLSGYSGFTDDHVDFLEQHGQVNGHQQFRHASDGTGSKGDSSSSGSAVGGGAMDHTISNNGTLTNWAQAPVFTASSTAASNSNPGPVTVVKASGGSTEHHAKG